MLYLKVLRVCPVPWCFVVKNLSEKLKGSREVGVECMRLANPVEFII
jgi:hypothetical protein